MKQSDEATSASPTSEVWVSGEDGPMARKLSAVGTLFRIGDSTCPRCETTLNTATPGDKHRTAPAVGDASVCAYCGQMLVFDSADDVDHLVLRKITAEEFIELSAEDRTLMHRVSKHAQAYYKRRKQHA